jgi:hypothetical protein
VASTAAAQDPAGRGARDVLARLPREDAVDPHVLDAGAPRDQPVGAAGLVVHPLGRRRAHAGRVERHQVREVPRPHHLARMNLRVALAELVRRRTDIKLKPGADLGYHSTFNRALLSVPITFTPASRS